MSELNGLLRLYFIGDNNTLIVTNDRNQLTEDGELTDDVLVETQEARILTGEYILECDVSPDLIGEGSRVYVAKQFSKYPELDHKCKFFDATQRVIEVVTIPAKEYLMVLGEQNRELDGFRTKIARIDEKYSSRVDELEKQLAELYKKKTHELQSLKLPKLMEARLAEYVASIKQ